MFHDIPRAVMGRMQHLEQLDARDRGDGTPHLQRVRQIPPETGRFLALLCACTPEGACIEIGTSAGYSALWLALACRQLGRKLTTFEILPEKVELAKETFRLAGVEDVVELIAGDAREHLPGRGDISFCFLDAEKKTYPEFYEMIVPKMVPGGLLAADNAVSHEETLRPVINRALSDERVDAVVVPIGRGELVCRKL